MYSVTQETIDGYKNYARQTISITLTPVVGDAITITHADVIANGLVVNRYSASGNAIQIGTCVAAELTLRLENGDGRFNSVSFEGAELSVTLGVNATGYTGFIQAIPLGHFTVIGAPRKLAVIELYALDHMVKFDKIADPTVFNFPETVRDVVIDCCVQCGFTSIAGDALLNAPNHDYYVQSIDPVGAMTYRNILQWCCQLMGVCAYIDDADRLNVSWYKKPTYSSGSGYVVPTITAADRYSSDFYENAITITGVLVQKGSTAVLNGTAGYVLSIANNPLLAEADVSTVAGNLGTLLGYSCHPFEASVLPMPYLYPMDIVNYTYKGTTYDVAISEVNIVSSGATGLKGTGRTETSQGYANIPSFSSSEIANIAYIARENQNAFSNIVVGNTTISADSETDTLTLVAGSNVTLTPNASNDSITIAATGGGGGGDVTDVKVDGSSVVSSGVATIPYGNGSGYGVVKVEAISQPGANATRISMKTTSGQGTSETQMIVPKLDSNNKILASYLPLATTSTAGAMSASDKAKLDALADSTLYGHTTGSSVSSSTVTVMASCDNGFFALDTDRTIFLKITEAIPTASSVYLFFDGTDPKLLYNTTSSDLSVGLTYIIHYDGTKFIKDGVVMDVATTSVNGAMSASDKTKLDGIASGAEVNQNAFSKVAVGNTTIQADSKTDTLTLVASDNITLTPNASTDTVTITANVPVTDVQTESNGEATSIVSSGMPHFPKQTQLHTEQYL